MTSPKKMALGRGLDALISTDLVKTQGSSSINEVPLHLDIYLLVGLQK